MIRNYLRCFSLSEGSMYWRLWEVLPKDIYFISLNPGFSKPSPCITNISGNSESEEPWNPIWSDSGQSCSRRACWRRVQAL